MKNRILIYLTLAFTMGLAACGGPTAPATEPVTEPVAPPVEPAVVFVANELRGSADGSSPENATTFNYAFGMCKKNGGTIVVFEPTELEKFPDEIYYFPSNEKGITVTSQYGGVDYRQTNNASLSIPNDVYFNGDYTVENIVLIAEKNDILLCLQYNSVTLGEGIECKLAQGVTGDMHIVCGYRAKHAKYHSGYQVSCHEDAEITVRSGTWATIRGGNMRVETASVFGTVDKDATLVIRVEGGTFTAKSGNVLSAATGMNSVDGTVYMEISGGEFMGPVFALARTGSQNADYEPYVNGEVTLKITGGIFHNVNLGVFHSTSRPELRDDAKVTVCIEALENKTAKVSVSGSNDEKSTLVLSSAVEPIITPRQFGSKQVGDELCAQIKAPELDFTPRAPEKPEPMQSLDRSPLSADEIAKLNAKAHREVTVVLESYKTRKGDTYIDMRRLKDPENRYSFDGIQDVRYICTLTGEYSQNRTSSNFGVGGVDIGQIVDCGDFVLFLFGDTDIAEAEQSGFAHYWRSNTIAYSYDTDYTDGIDLDGFYVNGEESGEYAGNAYEFLTSDHRRYVDQSKIPTGGVLIGDTLYVTYFSVYYWDKDGTGIWTCNYGGLAKSTDYGRSFEILSDIRWPASTGGDGYYPGNNGELFPHPSQGYSQLYPVLDGEWVYFFGVPGGRKGDIKIMRVKAEDIENFAAYEYMVGRDENGKGIFEKGYDAMMSDFVAIEGGAGGISVAYNEYLGEWVMVYLTPSSGSVSVAGVVMRSAKTLDGLWSDTALVASHNTWIGFYEPSISSRFMTDGGKKMMIVVSRFDMYNTMLIEVELRKK